MSSASDIEMKDKNTQVKDESTEPPTPRLQLPERKLSKIQFIV